MSMHRRALSWLRVAAFLPCASAASEAGAADVVVSIEHEGRVTVVHADARVAASVATAWRVLTDYDGYDRFIPGVRASRTLARDGANVTVAQSDDVAIGVLPLRVDVTYDIMESPPDRLRSHAHAGALPVLDSVYTLVPDASGVRVDYVGRIEGGLPLIAPLARNALAATVARQFEALAGEIERRTLVAHRGL
ncbi:MAG: SRPBCC family protein [Betaproteobacteria bacterium]|jgi:ribosome-associated toxin RatA of RatAB toxin-antitoxin module